MFKAFKFRVRVLQGSDLKNDEKVPRCHVPLLLHEGWAGLPGAAPGGGYGAAAPATPIQMPARTRPLELA